MLQAGLQRERRAMESLIHAKGHMVIPAFADLSQVFASALMSSPMQW